MASTQGQPYQPWSSVTQLIFVRKAALWRWLATRWWMASWITSA